MQLQVCCSVAIYSGVQCKTVSSVNPENQNYKFQKFPSLFQFWVGLFLNFREIEPTVSYSLLLIKKTVYIIIQWCSMSRLFRVRTRKIKIANYEIEHTVSYKLFLIKKM